MPTPIWTTSFLFISLVLTTKITQGHELQKNILLQKELISEVFCSISYLSILMIPYKNTFVKNYLYCSRGFLVLWPQLSKPLCLALACENWVHRNSYLD